MIYRKEDYLAILSWKKKKLSWKLSVIAAMRAENAKQQKKRKQIRKKKPKNRHRNRGFAVEEMDRLPDAFFIKMFRLDRATFTELAEMIDYIIKRNEMKSVQSSGSCIPTDTRLAVKLLGFVFCMGIAGSTFFSDRGVLWPTIGAFYDVE